VKPGRPVEEEHSNRKLNHHLFHKLEDTLIEQNLNWSRSTDKVTAFIEWVHRRLLRQEQKSRQEQKWGVHYRLFKRAENVCWNLSLVLAYAINVMILIAGELQFPVLNTILFVMCLVGLGFALFSTVGYFVRYGSEINQLGWLRHFPKDRSYILLTWKVIRENKLNVTRLRYVLLSTKHWISDPYAIYLFLYLFAAILGVVVSPFFFAFHLTQIFLRSTHLRFVIKAIYHNILMLLLVFLVVVCAVYILSIFSFLFFQAYYNDNTGRPCDTILQCTTTNVFFGMPSEGGLFEYLNPPDSRVVGYLWVLFIVGFYFVIGVILLNVGLAVLVDTFAGITHKHTLN
jgi:hypothetical protein